MFNKQITHWGRGGGSRGGFRLCVMVMELNFVLNQISFKFCVKIIEIKSLRNPKNQSQAWTRDVYIYIDIDIKVKLKT